MAARPAGCVQPAKAPCFLWDVQGTPPVCQWGFTNIAQVAQAQLACGCYPSQPLLAVGRQSALATPEGSAAGLHVRGHLTCKAK